MKFTYLFAKLCDLFPSINCWFADKHDSQLTQAYSTIIERSFHGNTGDSSVLRMEKRKMGQIRIQMYTKKNTNCFCQFLFLYSAYFLLNVNQYVVQQTDTHAGRVQVFTWCSFTIWTIYFQSKRDYFYSMILSSCIQKDTRCVRESLCLWRLFRFLYNLVMVKASESKSWVKEVSVIFLHIKHMTDNLKQLCYEVTLVQLMFQH